MASFKGGYLLDVKTDAFNIVSGAISGTTPKVSGWQRMIGVDTVTLALSSTGTANGVWTAEVATSSQGQDAKPLPTTPSPAFPTGVASSASPVITLPGDEFVYLRMTFTPSAGAGNAVAAMGAIVSRPEYLCHQRQLGVAFITPAADTLAGQSGIQFSANWDGRLVVGGPTRTPTLQANSQTNPAQWFDAIDQTNVPFSIPALVASTGANVGIRMGLVEFNGLRATFTPTAGFGTCRISYNSK